MTEEIEELRSQKNRILARAKCDDDESMKTFTANLEQAKRNYNDLIERKTALTAERQDGIMQYVDIYEKILPGDEDAVRKEQQRLRAEGKNRLSETVSKIYGMDFDPYTLSDATKATDLDLVMDRRVYEHRKWLYAKNKKHLPSYQRDNSER